MKYSLKHLILLPNQPYKTIDEMQNMLKKKTVQRRN